MTAPVPSKLGTPYGKRCKPGHPWALGRHTGADYLAPEGTRVGAPAPSYITHAGWGGETAYGLHVRGRTTVNGVTYEWIAAHLSHVNVAVGQTVQTDQLIGLSGHTGNAFGPHLHFEVRAHPYTFGKDVDPRVLTEATVRDKPQPKPKPGTVTEFSLMSWNMMATRYSGVPWAPRAKGISDEIRGEADIFVFQEVFTEEQANTIHDAIGRDFDRTSGHAGLEIFNAPRFAMDFDHPLKEGGYSSGIQSRYCQILHLLDKGTGQHFAIANYHAPALSPRLRSQYGRWLRSLFEHVDGPLIAAGDNNTKMHSLSPRKDIEALGYRTMEQQASIINENMEEFPGKGSLADIYSIPSQATILAGLKDNTSPKLSDHKRIEASRIRIVAK